ncbi:MAG TPA: aminotransferase class I/II-fold pyridoxal phosphate-dependent enzyme [Longimicrobiaceae bacterium]|nr:aminotransferase class I/II-fold pyridoxal phosphate-dependent enzyme [Longimicrobiaceae bacterium]
MAIPDFKLERYLARWEFAAPHLLCTSDVEALPMSELLEMADPETRALWDGLKLGYTEAAGHPLLRAEIASLYEGVSPEEVLVFAGAEEAIYVFMRAALGPGDRVAVTWPGYQSLYEVARSTGAEVDLLPLDPDRGWALDPDLLRATLSPATRAIVVNYPHNPTGALPSREEWTRLVELAREAGVLLFSDEVYRFLEHDPADRLPAAVESYERGFSLGVMSKSFALAGLRVGWLATHDAELLRRIASYKDYTSICCSAPSELLALMALRAREAVLERSRRIVRGNLELLDPFFRRWEGVLEWTRPRAGSTAFPRLAPEVHVEAFADELREAEGVLVLPGTLMDYPGNHLRIGYGRTGLPAALDGLDRFLAARFGRP